MPSPAGDPVPPAMRAGGTALDDVRAIYTDGYAREYADRYLDPWPDKHRINAAVLTELLGGLPRAQTGMRPRWLDLACGQAWHFAALAGRAEMLGVDCSDAQLERARARCPHAAFHCADMTRIAFAPGAFDLVTNFWAGYCYLRDEAEILGLFERAAGWLVPGGALYLEVLTGEALAAFNASGYAERTGFAVTDLSEDGSAWTYADAGGTHVMTSPPLDRFLEVLGPRFGSVQAHHSGGFMIDVVCRERRG